MSKALAVFPMHQALSSARLTAAVAFGLAAGLTLVPDVAAQTYPSKPVRMIVPYAPGGSTDISSRLLANAMSPRLGQQILVENKAGAAGGIGIYEVVRSTPDGHTIGISGVGPTILANLSGVFTQYNTLRDLVMVTHMNNVELVLAARKDLPASGLQEVIKLAKASPGRISAGNSGPTGPGHMSMVLLGARAAADFNHVHYKGDSTVLQDLLSGSVDLGVLSVAGASSALKAGSVKSIAMFGSRRSAGFPDAPTVSEQGIPDYESYIYQLVVAPIKTPAPIVARLNEVINESLATAQIKDEYARIGMIPTGGTTQEATSFVKRETEKWSRVFEMLNAKK